MISYDEAGFPWNSHRTAHQTRFKIYIAQEGVEGASPAGLLFLTGQDPQEHPQASLYSLWSRDMSPLAPSTLISKVNHCYEPPFSASQSLGDIVNFLFKCSYSPFTKRKEEE